MASEIPDSELTRHQLDGDQAIHEANGRSSMQKYRYELPVQEKGAEQNPVELPGDTISDTISKK